MTTAHSLSPQVLQDPYGHHHPDYLRGAASAIGQKVRFVSMAKTVVSWTGTQKETKNSNDFWSERQDSNLRPLRPERVVPLFISCLFSVFRRLQQSKSTFVHGVSVPVLSRNFRGNILLEVGMMMPVDAIEQLRAHSEEPCSIPTVRAVLHCPGRGRVAQDVGCKVAFDSSRFHRGGKRFADRAHGLSVPLDDRVFG